MTPSADELPARKSIIVRLSQNGLVCLAMFYALVLGTTLPLGTLARATIDRMTSIPRPASLIPSRSLEQIRNVRARGDDLRACRAQLDQESGAIAVDELDSREVDAPLGAIGVRCDERPQLRDPWAHEPSLEAHEDAIVAIDLGDPEHDAKWQQVLCQPPACANMS